jgi:hypothetical protein
MCVCCLGSRRANPSKRASVAGSPRIWRRPILRTEGGRLLAATAALRFNQIGKTSGLSLGNFAIVASLTFRCWATIADGVRAIQSDSETSAK